MTKHNIKPNHKPRNRKLDLYAGVRHYDQSLTDTSPVPIRPSYAVKLHTIPVQHWYVDYSVPRDAQTVASKKTTSTLIALGIHANAQEKVSGQPARAFAVRHHMDHPNLAPHFERMVLIGATVYDGVSTSDAAESIVTEHKNRTYALRVYPVVIGVQLSAHKLLVRAEGTSTPNMLEKLIHDLSGRGAYGVAVKSYTSKHAGRADTDYCEKLTLLSDEQMYAACLTRQAAYVASRIPMITTAAQLRTVDVAALHPQFVVSTLPPIPAANKELKGRALHAVHITEELRTSAVMTYADNPNMQQQVTHYVAHVLGLPMVRDTYLSAPVGYDVAWHWERWLWGNYPMTKESLEEELECLRVMRNHSHLLEATAENAKLHLTKAADIIGRTYNLPEFARSVERILSEI